MPAAQPEYAMRAMSWTRVTAFAVASGSPGCPSSEVVVTHRQAACRETDHWLPLESAHAAVST
jgi:hypothetical protein